MKKWLIGDFFTYFIAPIIILSIFKGEFKIYSIITISIILITYSMSIKNIQSRINFSGNFFSFTYILIQLLKQRINNYYNIDLFNAYCLIAFVIIMLILNMLDKDIFKILYIDIMKILNFSKIQSFSIIKKFNLYKYFNQITSISMIHLLSLGLIKIYFLISLGKHRNFNNLNIEVVICSTFFLIELIIFYKFIKEIRLAIIKNNIKNVKNFINDSKVIKIDSYKNINK